MPHVLRDGCRLSYSLDGNPQAPALMFSNSLGTTRELWAPQVARLSSAFRVIRYDTRGQGGSDAPKGTYTIEMLGLDALAILDAAGAPRAHVCGLSLGGLTAMWLGVRQPARVQSLVVVDALPEVIARHGVAATSQPLATQAGIATLRAGGNAVDAALATAIALTICEPCSNGLGSDLFAIVWDGSELVGLNASGRAPTGPLRGSGRHAARRLDDGNDPRRRFGLGRTVEAFRQATLCRPVRTGDPLRARWLRGEPGGRGKMGEGGAHTRRRSRICGAFSAAWSRAATG